MTIIQRINQYASERGLQRKAICKASGATYSMVSTWTSANVESIPSEYVYPIAKLLGVTTEELLTGEKVTPPIAEDEKKLLELYRRLDWDGKQIVMAELVKETRRIESGEQK